MKTKLISKIKDFLQLNGDDIYLADAKITFPDNIIASHNLHKEIVHSYIWQIFLSNSQSGIMVTTFFGKGIDLSELDNRTISFIYATLKKRQKELENPISVTENENQTAISPETFRQLLKEAGRILQQAGQEAGNAEDAMYQRLYTGYTNHEDKSRKKLAVALSEARKGLRILEMVVNSRVDFEL